jgi:hypothetical protein
MGLVVSAQVIRELIADGEYLVECIEQRERGKVTVALALRSRMQPYSIQIETMDNKLGGLFRALLDEKSSRAESTALVKLGSQPVPIVEVDTLPADASKGRRRRKQGANDADSSQPGAHTKPASRGRRSVGQLVLMPQEAPDEPAPMSTGPKRRRTARANDRGAPR